MTSILTAGHRAGEAEAQFDLGLMYHFGEGTVADDNQAAAWWRMAAKQRHPTAELWLGEIYRLGTGVAKEERHQ